MFVQTYYIGHVNSSVEEDRMGPLLVLDQSLEDPPLDLKGDLYCARWPCWREALSRHSVK